MKRERLETQRSPSPSRNDQHTRIASASLSSVSVSQLLGFWFFFFVSFGWGGSTEFQLGNGVLRIQRPRTEGIPPPKKLRVQQQPRAIGSDLPIARRAALHRFFERRKDRFLYNSRSLDNGEYQPDNNRLWKKVWGMQVQPKVHYEVQKARSTFIRASQPRPLEQMPYSVSRPIWKPPPWPKLKVNFDGAVFRENQRVEV
nr:hypothetical protein CFP56_27854 [Quercus suber]